MTWCRYQHFCRLVGQEMCPNQRTVTNLLTNFLVLLCRRVFKTSQGHRGGGTSGYPFCTSRGQLWCNSVNKEHFCGCRSHWRGGEWWRGSFYTLTSTPRNPAQEWGCGCQNSRLYKRGTMCAIGTAHQTKSLPIATLTHHPLSPSMCPMKNDVIFTEYHRLDKGGSR